VKSNVQMRKCANETAIKLELLSGPIAIVLPKAEPTDSENEVFIAFNSVRLSLPSLGLTKKVEARTLRPTLSPSGIGIQYHIDSKMVSYSVFGAHRLQ